MSLLFLEEDPWLLEYVSCEKLHRDIMEQLGSRQKHTRTSDEYSQLSANIRLRLKQFNNEVGQLMKKLEDSSKLMNITPDEFERRCRQVEVLQSLGLQMQTIFEDQIVSKLREHRISLGGNSATAITPVSSSSIDDLRQHRKVMLGDQEKGLDTLSKIISRQKDIANTISDEVDFHNEILGDLETQIIRTDEELRRETKHIDVVDRKDKTFLLWVIIILLFLSIVVLAVV